MGVAAAPLISGLLGLLVLDDLTRAYVAANGGGRAEDEASAATITGAVLGGLLAVVYLVPAFLLGRPRNSARVVTWVLCGLGLCCLSPGVLGGSSLTSPRIMNSGVTSGSLSLKIQQMTPGWYMPATVTLAAASVIAAILAAVLIALPASNAYFRRPMPGSPPPGYPPGPGHPGYPATFGYPPAPGYPQGQGYLPPVQGQGYPPPVQGHGYPQGQGYPPPPVPGQGYPQGQGYPPEQGPQQPPAGWNR